MIMTILVEAIGWISAILVLAAYGLLSSGRMHAHSAGYQLMNIVGAVGLAINTAWNGAIPSAALNVVWSGIGIYALIRHTATEPEVGGH
jgi:cell division protein FtsW (lipid II flippase)